MRKVLYLLVLLGAAIPASAASLPVSYALDFGLYRTGNSRFLLDYDFNHVPDQKIPFGTAGDKPLLGDMDANGVNDLVLYRQGTWFVDADTLDGVPSTVLYFGGVTGDIPLLGDLTGEGRADLVIYRSGVWYGSTQLNGQADRIYYFGGAPGDIPMLGDFNQDGIADLVIFRNGTWYVDMNRDGQADAIYWFGGVAGDVPLLFDWDHDGALDFCIFRSGLWYVNTRRDGTLQAFFAYGAAGDIPLAGTINRANTIFVNANASAPFLGTLASPFNSLRAAFTAAVDGSIIRVAGGNYAETLSLYGPDVQYAPGQFGKNNLKIIGVSRNSVHLVPASGDSVELYGSTGQILEKLHFAAAASRGITLIGGAGSVAPTLPAASVTVRHSDFSDVYDYGVLVTGTSRANLYYNKINRSKNRSGVSVQGAGQADIQFNEISENGTALPPLGGNVDGGRGVEARDSSVVTLTRNTIRANQGFGVIGITNAQLSLTSNTIEANGLNGVIVCGITAGDTTTSTLLYNWIAANGTQGTGINGYNGLEIYLTCTGSHTVNGNVFAGNSLNGIYIGSGTAVVSNNAFVSNYIGVTASSEAGTGTNVSLTLQGNDFDQNTLDGLYVSRTASPSLTVSVGGTAAGLANSFTNHSLHGIGCQTGTEAITCPSGGNVFSGNANNIEGTCPGSCVQ